jgi:uncharacterized protein
MSDIGTERYEVVAITGGTGLIGGALTRVLRQEGVEVRPVTRQAGVPNSIRWDPARGYLDHEALRGVTAVVNLAGESVGERWSAEKKQRIRDSRVEGTRLLVDAISALDPAPRVLVSASAVGYYGDRGDEELREESPPGTGFFPEMAIEWETAAQAAESRGVRVVRLRFGIVLDREGGALERMLLPFQLGAGGRLGDGRQWMSWVSLPDVVAILRFALRDPSASGVYNAVAPEPVRNADFTRSLGRALGRPTVAAVPAFALRLAFGEMADWTLLISHRVLPERLLAAGFTFQHPRLEDGLRAALAKR